MGHGSAPNHATAVVPLFPLPNVVLLPRAILPLHIFEERYKTMTADVLRGARRIALALLKPGWEPNYYGKALIDPIVCVGEILTHELLADGKYNFLLRGEHRARIVREITGHDYRLAEVELIEDIHPAGNELGDARQALVTLLQQPEMGQLPAIEQFRELADGLLPVGELSDLLAFHLLEDVALKQELLGLSDVRRRVDMTLAALERLRSTLPPARRRVPPNPSMN